MFDNIQTVNNAETGNSDINFNLFEDYQSASDKTGSQSTNWTNDGTRFNVSGDSTNIPSLQLIDYAALTPKELQASNESDLAQAPTEMERRSAKMLEDLTKYASDKNLTFSNLDAVGVNNVKQSLQRVVDNCPKNGDEKQTETGGQLTGLTSFGPNGQRVPVRTGQTIDRYQKNEEGIYCHTRTVNTMGARGDAERVMETENHTKIYMYNQIPANGEVRIDVLLPDGKSGCQINVKTNQLKEVLNRIKQTDREQTTIAPAS